MKFLILLACIGISLAATVLAGNDKTKIINGEEVGIHQAPYHVSLQTKTGNHKCGGTIISKNLVLTSAECAFG